MARSRFGFLYNPESGVGPGVTDTNYNVVSKVDQFISSDVLAPVESMKDAIEKMKVVSHSPAYDPYANDFNMLKQELQAAKQMSEPGVQAIHAAEVEEEKEQEHHFGAGL